jgi:hypothetical protein
LLAVLVGAALFWLVGELFGRWTPPASIVVPAVLVSVICSLCIAGAVWRRALGLGHVKPDGDLY